MSIKNKNIKKTLMLTVIGTVLLPAAVNASGLKPPFAQNAKVSVEINGINKSIPDNMGLIFVDGRTNRTMVPVRYISEELGAVVNYIPKDENNKAYIVIGLKDSILKMEVGSKTIKKIGFDGAVEYIETDAPVYIYDARAYVPVRFVSKGLGLDVKWENNKVSIVKAKVSETDKDILENKIFVNGAKFDIYRFDDALWKIDNDKAVLYQNGEKLAIISKKDFMDKWELSIGKYGNSLKDLNKFIKDYNGRYEIEYIGSDRAWQRKFNYKLKDEVKIEDNKRNDIKNTVASGDLKTKEEKQNTKNISVTKDEASTENKNEISKDKNLKKNNNLKDNTKKEVVADSKSTQEVKEKKSFDKKVSIHKDNETDNKEQKNIQKPEFETAELTNEVGNSANAVNDNTVDNIADSQSINKEKVEETDSKVKSHISISESEIKESDNVQDTTVNGSKTNEKDTGVSTNDSLGDLSTESEQESKNKVETDPISSKAEKETKTETESAEIEDKTEKSVDSSANEVKNNSSNNKSLDKSKADVKSETKEIETSDSQGKNIATDTDEQKSKKDSEKDTETIKSINEIDDNIKLKETELNNLNYDVNKLLNDFNTINSNRTTRINEIKHEYLSKDISKKIAELNDKIVKLENEINVSNNNYLDKYKESMKIKVLKEDLNNINKKIIPYLENKYKATNEEKYNEELKKLKEKSDEISKSVSEEKISQNQKDLDASYYKSGQLRNEYNLIYPSLLQNDSEIGNGVFNANISINKLDKTLNPQNIINDLFTKKKNYEIAYAELQNDLIIRKEEYNLLNDENKEKYKLNNNYDSKLEEYNTRENELKNIFKENKNSIIEFQNKLKSDQNENNNLMNESRKTLNSIKDDFAIKKEYDKLPEDQKYKKTGDDQLLSGEIYKDYNSSINS